MKTLPLLLIAAAISTSCAVGPKHLVVKEDESGGRIERQFAGYSEEEFVADAEKQMSGKCPQGYKVVGKGSEQRKFGRWTYDAKYTDFKCTGRSTASK